MSRKTSRLLVTALLAFLVVPGAGWMGTPVEGGKVILNKLSDGNTTFSAVFADAGSAGGATITVPKAAVVQKATLTVQGSAVFDNSTFNATTQSDFAAFELSNVDINTTTGSATLFNETGYSDEFNSTTLDPRWTWFNQPGTYNVNTTTADQLRIVTDRNTNFGQGANNGHLLYQTVNGSYIVETRLTADPSQNYEKTGLMIRKDNNNYLMFYYGTQTGAGGRSLIVRVRYNGVQWQDLINPLVASPLYLRLIKDNRSFWSQYSTDGTNWNFHRAWNVSFNDPVSLGIFAADGTANVNWPVDFDYFRFSQYRFPGSLVSPAVPTRYNVSSVRAIWNRLPVPLNTSIAVNVRGSPASAWQSIGYDTSTKLTAGGNLTQYKVDITTTGIRAPVLDDITLWLASSSLPAQVSLGLGDTPFWNYTGALSTNVSVNFTPALSSHLALAVPDGNGNVSVPFKLTTQAGGILTIKNITIEYIIGNPPASPVQIAPGPAEFVSTLNPAIKFAATDVDGDNLYYSLDLSTDNFCTTVTYRQDTQPGGWSKTNPFAPGENATYTLQLPLTQGQKYLWRVKAYDGAYWGNHSGTGNFTVDTTPAEGTVLDEGKTTTTQDMLTAQFDFHDDTSGVTEYEYMVGNTPNASNVFPMSATGNTTVTVKGLSLKEGTTYYFTARARNGAGLWSDWRNTDGINYATLPPETEGVRISNPLNNSRVMAGVEIAGTAWVLSGWTRSHGLQLRIDSGEWKFAQTDTAEPLRNWTMSWNSREVPDGVHTIQARVVIGVSPPVELASVSVTINVLNAGTVAALTAEFTPDSPINVNENTTVPLSVRVLAGNPRFIWTFDGRVASGEAGTAYAYNANYTSAGNHNITVTLKDGLETLQHSWRVDVANVNRPPVAGIYRPADLTRYKPDQTVGFDASSTIEQDAGDTINYTWDFNDGTLGIGKEVSHEYTKAGTYKVVLIVSDGQYESRAYVTVKVVAPVNPTFWDTNGQYIIFGLIAAVIAAAVIGAGVMASKRAVTRREENEQKRIAEDDKREREQDALEARKQKEDARKDAALYPALAPLKTSPAAGKETAANEVPEAAATPVEDIPEAPALAVDEKVLAAPAGKISADKPSVDNEANIPRMSEEDKEFNSKMKDALASLGNAKTADAQASSPDAGKAPDNAAADKPVHKKDTDALEDLLKNLK